MANDLRLQVLLQALDKASAPLRRIGGGGKEAADGLRKTRDQLRQLNQAQQQVSGFRKLKNDAEASGIAMRAAQQRAAQLRQEMAATEAPTRKAAAAYNKAEREVTKLKNAHLANLTAVREQRAALSAAGVSANGLGSAERRLGMEVSFATAKLHRQTEALRAQGTRLRRHETPAARKPRAQIHRLPHRQQRHRHQRGHGQIGEVLGIPPRRRGITQERLKERAMRISKFADRDKCVPEGTGVDLDGTPVRRQRGMIYWYRWGRHSFDVRVMRKILGLQENHEADKWFMPNSTYLEKPDQALRDIVEQLRTALGEGSFRKLLSAHDQALKAA